MKSKFTIRKGYQIAAIILAVIVGCYFLYTALTAPSKFNTLTQHRKAAIESGMKIAVPASARFVEGYTIPGRDPTHIFILELELAEKETGETTDQFLRRKLRVKDGDYSISRSIGLSYTQNMYCAKLEEIGYAFEWVTNYIKDPFKEIYYKETDTGKLQAALVYGTS